MAYTTIDDPSAYFQALSYSGAGGSSNISRTFDGNSDLQPDLTWHKSRGQTYDHYLFDSTRGVGLYLKSNSTVGDDGTGGDTTSLTSFDSDGFTLPGGTGISDPSAAIMCWGWKANGGTTTTNDASSTGVGSIDSVYQANTTAGFSIVSYTGTGSAGTIAHGLGAVPSWMVVKNRSKSGGEGWMVYHQGNTSAPETEHLQIHNTNATSDNDIAWNDTAPTSTVFSVKDDDSTNDSGETHIAYLWTDIQGYSKFGDYIGTGNDDGPFVYTGFKPAWLMIKRTTANAWGIYDSARGVFNEITMNLDADRTDAENTATNYDDLDFLSNGFKLREENDDINASGGTYIYMAFAEHPFVSSKGVPATAR